VGRECQIEGAVISATRPVYVTLITNKPSLGLTIPRNGAVFAFASRRQDAISPESESTPTPSI